MAFYGPYQSLANAIIVQACTDYRELRKERWRHDRLNPEDSRSLYLIIKFFKSEWFKILSEVKGEYLIEKLDDEFYKWVAVQSKCKKRKCASKTKTFTEP